MNNKEVTPDDIRWMCQYVEEFEIHPYSKDHIIDPEGRAWDFNYFIEGVYFPHFLTRTIEGINRKSRETSRDFTIMTNHAYISVYNWRIMKDSEPFYFADYKNEDECKISTIKYIRKNLSS